jgi:hypothetical protein
MVCRPRGSSPPKAIRLWSERHPFERIEAESLRGLPPPAEGHYRPFADPLFVVAGYSAA